MSPRLWGTADLRLEDVERRQGLALVREPGRALEALPEVDEHGAGIVPQPLDTDPPPRR